MATAEAVSQKILRATALRQAALNHLVVMERYAAQAIVDATAQTKFKVNFKKLSQVTKNFEKHHNTLLMLIASDQAKLAQENAVSQSFMERCTEVEAHYHDLFELDLPDTTLNQTVAPPSESSALPKMNLPIFKGDVQDFPSFIEFFNAIVHNRQGLSDIEKFKYLLSSVSGPALSLIKNIKLLGVNYQTAYDSLVSRYDNKRLRSVSHWKSIENTLHLSNDNVVGLRNLLDTFEDNLASLRNMGYDTNDWDFIMANMLLDRLDPSTRKSFEQKHASNNMPTYATIKNFVSQQCTALESLVLTPSSKSKSPNFLKTPRNANQSNLRQSTSTFFANNSSLVPSQKQITCFMCKGAHIIFKCSNFLAKTPHERIGFIKSHRACINCLASAHTVSQCNSEKRCRTCGQNHHSLLHLTFNNNPQNLRENINQNLPHSTHSNDPNNTQNEQSTSLSTDNKNVIVGMALNDHDILLATVLLHIRDNFGNWREARAILDSGAQSSFISKKFANSLGISKFNIALNVHGLEKMCTSARSGTYCTIAPLENKNTILNFEAIVIDKICDAMPSTSFNKNSLPVLQNLKLADPFWNIQSGVQLLLGADLYGSLIQDGRIYTGPDSPTCINTIFGWSLIGKMSPTDNNIIEKKISTFFTTFANNDDLDITLKQFWEIEEVPHVISRSSEDIFCEKYFLETTKTNAEGRYIVALPFKITSPDFGDTRAQALRRFYSLEKRLLGDKIMHTTYASVIREYLDMGHAQIVPQPNISELPSYFYIAHHAVRKESTSTPLRVVFDASSHAANKPSLNEALHPGPKLQRDLIDILLNFRLNRYVFTCDIRQMYRMILIDENHRKYQRILWRFSPDEPILDLQINVVTFGVNCSPYLAIRTLLKLADDHTDLPLASEIIKKSFYVDDGVVSSQFIEELVCKRNELIKLLGRAGFELRKWASNAPEVLAGLPESHVQMQDFSLDMEEDSPLKILGLRWSPKADTFFYSFNCSDRICTKRTLLSELARIYDPLGFLAPLTFFSKLLIQHLWTLGLGWDDAPPPEISLKWANFKRELSVLSDLRIPRIINNFNATFCELCGFCDASERGTCAVVYLRVRYESSEIKTFFVCAKSKIAPLRRLSIPKLELESAVLLAKLINFVKNCYAEKIAFTNIFAFTDSTVALSWIRSSPHCWKTYVSNRVTFIQEKIAPTNWYHVPSAKNAADPGSRGLFPNELLKCNLWWEGPDFLCTPQENWEFLDTKFINPPESFAEKRKNIFAAFKDTNVIDLLFAKFSSLGKIKRILSYVLRFLHNLKNSANKITSSFTFVELQNALQYLVKYTQSIYFATEITLLLEKKPLPKPFRKLNPFLDKNNILRVGGRLCYSQLDYDKKFPILLPSQCPLSVLLIREIHLKYLHSGVQTTLFLLLQNFWVLSAKRVIRKIISQCTTCWRISPTNFQPPMGNLPKFRVSQAKAFENVGVDLTGNFTITMSRIRGSKTLKAYVCLFICCATKAIHLELISDLSTEAFLAAFRRFMARRGRVKNVYSDNGTNFVGAAKYIKQIYLDTASRESLLWHFNPASAPHMGGLWESNIKNVKYHLSRVIGAQILTFEELSTVLTQVEAILNSRPLCPISMDINDLNALTPGHFISLEVLTALPDPDVSNIKLNRISRWQLLQKLHTDFWRRWHQEYLHTLQQRTKWNHADSPVAIGTMVLIKDEQLPPLNWSLGRIVELHPGSDHIARVATVKTTRGLMKRPLVKLCPLPNA